MAPMKVRLKQDTAERPMIEKTKTRTEKTKKTEKTKNTLTNKKRRDKPRDMSGIMALDLPLATRALMGGDDEA